MYSQFTMVDSGHRSPSIMRISSMTLVDQVYTVKHETTDVQCLMPGLILAIRKVVRLKVSID